MNFEYNNESDSTFKMPGNSKLETLKYRWWDPKYKCTVISLGVLLVIITIFLFAFLSFNKGEPVKQVNVDTLKVVGILFRHGDRTPTGTYNSDPYKNYSWPGGWGQLTNLGKKQLFELGETLRKRYTGFLPEDYSDDDILVKCSDRSRTLMSAYSLLAGLYPPTPEQTWNPKLKWQPIPVHSIPRDMDDILVTKRPCAYYDAHYEKVKNSTAVKEINDKFKDVYDLLTKFCNETVNTLLRVEYIYSHLEIQQNYGLKLPEWTKGIFPDLMKEMPGYSLAEYTFDDDMKKLHGGPLLKELISIMKDTLSSKKKETKKMHLYSGHDLSIVNLWRALTFEEIILPQFGAALVLELHSIPQSKDSEVQLLYYNSSYSTEPYQLKMPKCKEPCTFKQFQSLTKKYIPGDWNKECNKTEST